MVKFQSKQEPDLSHMVLTHTNGNSELYRAERPRSNFTHKQTHSLMYCCGLSRLKSAPSLLRCAGCLWRDGGEGNRGCLPDDYSVSPIMGCHLLSSVHKGKRCTHVCVRGREREFVCFLRGSVRSGEEDMVDLVGCPRALFHVFSVRGSHKMNTHPGLTTSNGYDSSIRHTLTGPYYKKNSCANLFFFFKTLHFLYLKHLHHDRYVFT